MSSWIFIDTAIDIINLCIITQLFETRIYFKNLLFHLSLRGMILDIETDRFSAITSWAKVIIDLAMESAGFTEGRSFVPT